MRRWLVILLVLLAAVLFVSPGIVRRLAERNMESTVNWADRENDEFSVTRESFNRNWFTSEGRYRIEFNAGGIKEILAALAGSGNGKAPALIVNTHIDHGLVPVTSMSRESGSLIPALAAMVSTLELDPGNGEPIDVPGRIYSRVGLTGRTASRLLLQAGAFDTEEIKAAWTGADVSVTSNPVDSSLSYEGTIEPATFELKTGTAQAELITLGTIKLQGDMRVSDYGLPTGTSEVLMDASSLAVQGRTFTLDQLTMRAKLNPREYDDTHAIAETLLEQENCCFVTN